MIARLILIAPKSITKLDKNNNMFSDNFQHNLLKLLN
jgi:hypothetical protein